jgi:hypothetical protein
LLYIFDTQITDAGLEHLKGLPRLGFLVLNQTRVTENGIQRFRQVLPKCKIQH